MDRCLIIFDIGGVFRDSSKALLAKPTAPIATFLKNVLLFFQ
jgi:hypothetical protein